MRGSSDDGFPSNRDEPLTTRRENIENYTLESSKNLLNRQHSFKARFFGNEYPSIAS